MLVALALLMPRLFPFLVCVCACACVCVFSPKVDFTKFADRIQSFTNTQG